MPDPRFGDYIENAAASPHDPRRIGRFVRVDPADRTGAWWECTDGRGEFWRVRPGSCSISTEHPADIPVLQAEIRSLRASVGWLRSMTATSSRDWSQADGDALIYGVLVGWGDALDTIAERHGWGPETVAAVERRRTALADHTLSWTRAAAR